MNTLQALSRYSFNNQQMGLMRRLGTLQGRQSTTLLQQSLVLDTLRQQAILESVKYGLALDSVHIDQEAAKQLVLSTHAPTSAVEFQAVGYQQALQQVLESAQHTTLDSVSIIELHHLLTHSYTAQINDSNSWRATNQVMLERNAKGERIGVLYRAPAARLVKESLSNCLAQYQQGVEQQLEPLLLIASITLDLFCIQPFSSGNYRLALLVMTLLLVQQNNRLPEFISLERIIMRHETSFQRALQLSSKNWHKGEHDPMTFINFFLTTLIRAFSELEDRTRSLQWHGAVSPKSQLIRSAIDKMQTPFAIADICLQTPTASRELVKKVVLQMRDQKLLSQVGKGRGARWVHIA